MSSGATELGELLVAAYRAFAQQGRARFGEHGLSAARVRLLTTLGQRPGSRMRDLADALGVSGRAITPLVDALESEGLVARRPDPDDRRAFRLTLTDAGLGAIDRIAGLQEQVSADIFGGMSTKDRRDLARLLRAFLDTAQEPGCAPG
ncbi:DNA-binding transcriptional regulator, MarR family [Nonomuraea maritima]|uniref:DNA-binding transcriptional regulator, MarR family n=1 Tax=Nonomuraea maritima TaxID=683260 RepID=A0A1G9N1I5_9ACTN|nr:MarR family transcriptional regulator [Nonomuraea maritima]SDL79987.1 DNA-binding transcriptional regulator, MarR family [Nonomuraea maritima]